MKTTRLIIITAFVGVMLFGSYVLGVKRTKDRLTVLSLGTLSQAMTAMQAIRSGDTTEALGPLESLCYANAVMLLASPRWREGKRGQVISGSKDRILRKAVVGIAEPAIFV